MELKKENALKFFQQSAWVAIASAAGTVLNGGVHFFADALGTEEYGNFYALLQAWQIMAIPSIGLAAVFMQFSVSAEALGHRAVLAGAVRSVFKLNLMLWCLFGLAFFLFRREAETYLKISGTFALTVTALVPPIAALVAIFTGIVQGEQNFAWYGGLQILAGASRLVFVSICIWILGLTAVNAAAGVLLGFVGVLAAAAWKTRSIWKETSAPFYLGPLVRKIVIFTAALGSANILFSLDAVMVERFFPSKNDLGLYGAAGVIAKVIVPLSASLIIVMFPKVARSKALAQKTDALLLTLGLTALGGVAATLFLTFFPGLPIRLIYHQKYLESVPLIPWYCWCLLPLPLANVLLYNLLARERYAVIPLMILIAGCYYWGLRTHHESLRQVIQTMGLAGLAYLITTAFFTWGWKEKMTSLDPSR